VNCLQNRELANELTGVLEQLGVLQDRMLDVIRGKLEAMRRSDVEAMTGASQRESELAAQVGTLDQRRCWLGVELSRLLGMPIPPRAENVSLRSLCSRLDGDPGAALARVGAALREKMLKVAEANRVVELVCREMLAHFKVVFSAFTRDEESPRMYSPRGAIESHGQVAVLDAVG